MASSIPVLICIVGPTAIGKTSMAIALARAFKTEIISADSRQFYREMSIGTAAPSPEELLEVPHHFIHTKSIQDSYSVGDYEKDSLNLIDEKFFPKDGNRGLSTLVLAGGSGLYVDAVVSGLDYFPPVLPGVREELNRELEVSGIEKLQQELQQADPEYYARVDLQNPHRLIRALEVFRSSGKAYSSFLNQKPANRKFSSVLIGLTADRPVIYERINQRVDAMIAQGLVEEARKLYEFRHCNALQTVGYTELFTFFENRISLEEAISEIKKNTRRFAKRQLTWFRKKPEITWFDYQTDPEEIVSFIKNKNA